MNEDASQLTLDDPAEIAVAFTVRDAVGSLNADARWRVLTWVAGSFDFDLTPRA